MGSWQLYDITPKNDSGVDFSTTANLKKGVKEGAILSFFEDKSYSELEGSGNFKSGKWEVDKFNNTISLTDQKSKTRNVNFTSEKNQKNKRFNTLQMEKGDAIFKFIKAGDALKNCKDDPFYAANNQWRTKPVALESTKELNKRMANHFKHLALLLKAVKERKEDIVSFEFSKGPVKIYNGAIGIYPYEIVPQDWKNTFYNDSSAHAAYNLFETYLKTSKLQRCRSRRLD